jgi:hypothetical protein
MEFLCWLNLGHFPRREPFIVKNKWRTRIRCKCGAINVFVDGLPVHPRMNR